MTLQLCMVSHTQQSMKVLGWCWMQSLNAPPYVLHFLHCTMSNAPLLLSLLRSHHQDSIVVLEQLMEFLSGLKSHLFGDNAYVDSECMVSPFKMP